MAGAIYTCNKYSMNTQVLQAPFRMNRVVTVTFFTAFIYKMMIYGRYEDRII